MVSNSTYPFPDEFAPPKKKEKPDYQLQAAKAIYYANNRFGYRMFSETQQYNALMELAQGRQSVDNIYKMFGFFSDRGTQDQQEALAYIDVQVLNLVTKYVNRAVAKLQRFKFGINLAAVDPLSVDQAKDYSSKIDTLYKMKAWYEGMKIDPQQFFPGLNLSMLPEHPEELMFNLSLNPKLKRVIDGEKTLQLISGTINDLDQRQRECDWYNVVIGRSHLHCYLNENGMPKVDTVNPKFWLGSYVDNEDYSKQEYAGFIDFITANQIKKETEGKLGKAKIEELLGAHAFPNTAASYGILPEFESNFDGLEYLPVMRYYFLSNDNVAYKTWRNDRNMPMIDQRHYQYFRENPKPGEKIIQNSYTSVYGGTWVIDSDVVYGEGRVNIPRTNLVDARLPIITFAPNMKEGRIVSLVAQMGEVASMMNVAWNRMKDILAKGRMGPIHLNLSAIDNVMLGPKGEAWSQRQAMDFFLQSNIWASRDTINQYGQSLGESIRELPSGLTLGDYMLTINQCIRFMDELAGSSVIESSQIPDRMTTGTMKANVAAGSDAIEYLVNGRMKMKKDSSHMLLLLSQAAKQDKIKIQGMIPALGTDTTEFFEVPDELPYCEYGLQMIAEPTEEEWMMFWGEVMESVKSGRLNSSDSAYIRQFKNLTMARQVMANRERINEMKAAEMQQQERKFQMDIAKQSDEAKMQREMALEDQKKKNEMEIIALQGKIDDLLQTKELAMKADISAITDMVKKDIAKQTGIDTVVKEAMRSRSEDYKSDKQFEGKIRAAEKQAETSLEAARIQAKKIKQEKGRKK